MYDLYYWPTPNGHKVTLFLEEMALAYTLVPVNIRKGEQFADAFLRISPNNRMPALIDNDTGIHLFESGAILLYLAEKHHAFLPDAGQERAEVLQWLFWQVAGLGPMMGQAGHFRNDAPEKLPYAIERYTNESLRLLKVMDKRLADRPFLAGESYSIADMAAYPWAAIGSRLLEGGPEMPNLHRWVESIAGRDATQKAYARAKDPMFATGEMTDDERRLLFRQGAETVRS
ncbi:MAG: glutathione S-transferase N-terminal domain-containing protein [Sphingomonadaceae bacterium]